MSANFDRWIFISATTLLFLAPPWADAQLYTAGTTPAPRGGYPYDSNIGVTPAMAIIFICIVVIFFLMGCISVYARRCIDDGTTVASDGVAVGRRTRPSEGLDFTVIESFPTFIYSEVKGLKIGKGTLECAVCLNEFEDEEMLRLLPKCSHVFHPTCIDAWLSSNITCPVCRAILVPTPGDPDNFILPVSVSETRDDIDSPRHPNSNHDTDEHDMIIDILSPETVNNIQIPKQFFPPRSASRKVRFTEKFRRSFTTGHVLIRPGDDRERFTLRLSEEARSQLVNSSLSRTKSGVTFPRARSLRKGYRSASAGATRGRSLFNYERFDRDGRLDRWVFTRTPSVFSRAGSVRSPNWSSGDARSGDHVAAAPKNLLKSVKSPFHRLFGTADSSSNNKGDVDVGERSFSRLRLDDGQV